MISKAELGLLIKWSYTRNMKKTKTDVIDEIWDRVNRHILCNEVYSCGLKEDSANPYREYVLSVTEKQAVLSFAGKELLLMDYTQEPSWKPKETEEKKEQAVLVKKTDEVEKLLSAFVLKSRQRRAQFAFSPKKRKPTSLQINDVEIKSPSYEDESYKKEYLLSLLDKTGGCLKKMSFIEDEEDDSLVPRMLLWIKRHSKVKIDGEISFPYSNSLANKLYETAQKDFLLCRCEGRLQKSLWTRFAPSLVKLLCMENSTCILVETILLKKEFQRKGVGTNLLKDMVDYADQTGKVLVLPIHDKYGISCDALKRFFRKFGFQYVGLLDDKAKPIMMRFPEEKQERKNKRRVLNNEQIF